MADSESSSSELALHIIRIALIASVVISAVVFGIVLDRMGEPILQPEARRPVRLGVLGFWALLVLVIAVVSRRRSGASGKRTRALTVIGWALAQAIGLVGVVYYFLTGALLYVGVGLALQLVISFVVLPAPSGR